MVSLCGIGVHLVAELAGLGWRADAELIFSAHHIPLGLLAVAALGALVAVGADVARRPNRDAAIVQIVRALPGSGQGLRFLSLAFAAQFFVFGVTEAGEGAPVPAGDLCAAVVAALCASVIGSLLVWRSQPRLLAVISGLVVRFIGTAASPVSSRQARRRAAHLRVRRCRALVFASSRRPPPLTL